MPQNNSIGIQLLLEYLLVSVECMLRLLWEIRENTKITKIGSITVLSDHNQPVQLNYFRLIRIKNSSIYVRTSMLEEYHTAVMKCKFLVTRPHDSYDTGMKVKSRP